MPTLRSFRNSQTFAPDRNWSFWRSFTVWLMLVVAVAVGYQDRLYSTSIDFAAHGTLVSELMSSWSLPEADASLAEMASYPRVAHQIASIAGHFTGSAIQGMQQTAIISLFLLWSMVGVGFSGLTRNRFIAAIATLTGIIAIGHLQFGIEFFGSELIASYFFAQLVAQALGMAILVFAIRKEWTAPDSIWPITLIAICVPLLASVHLLAALELLGTLAILILLHGLQSGPKRWTRRILTSSSVFVISLALLAANPDFLSMVRISTNNGGILLRHVTSIQDAVVLAIVAAFVSCCMLYQWWRKRSEPRTYLELLHKYFGAFGLATAGLCLTQIIVFRLFSLGSEYACLKYVIALQSQLAISAALLAALCIRESSAARTRWPTSASIAASLFAVATCACIFSGPVAFHTEALVSAELEARQFERSQSAPAAGKYNFAMGIDGVPAIGNYFISHGILGSPSFGISMDVLYARIPKLSEQVNQILTSKGSIPWDIPACRRGRAGEMVVVDGACAYGNFHALKCKDTIEFSSQGALDRGSSGFSIPSPEGRWSEGPEATLTCEQGNPASAVAYFYTAGLVTDSHTQRMAISVNDTPSQTIEYTTQTPAHTIAIPLPADNSSQLTFRFAFPDAISPAELGMSTDDRKLAVFMYRLRFE